MIEASRMKHARGGQMTSETNNDDEELSKKHDQQVKGREVEECSQAPNQEIVKTGLGSKS